jgi:hypothetical protein
MGGKGTEGYLSFHKAGVTGMGDREPGEIRR